LKNYWLDKSEYNFDFIKEVMKEINILMRKKNISYIKKNKIIDNGEKKVVN